MILSYNWQIIEQLPRSVEELQGLVKVPAPQDQELFGGDSHSNTIQPHALRLPVFGFLFSYFVEEPKTAPPDLDITPELTLLEEPIALRVVREMRCRNCICLQLLVDNSEVHDVLMVLTVRVLYHLGPKPQRVGSIQNLVRLAGNRQLNLHSAATYAAIRKELLIESPVSIEHRHRKEGCLLVKVLRGEEGSSKEVEVTGVELMNWLATGNEALKREGVVGVPSGAFRLRNKQAYVLAFRVGSSLAGVEMPIAVSYRFPPEERTFKMVRMLRGEASD